MWIIKNRVTGEYDTKGQSHKRDRVNRHGWATLGHAKCHVVNGGWDEWYLEADFLEITEDGVGRVVPVVDYLREYYKNSRYIPEKRKEQVLSLLSKEENA